MTKNDLLEKEEGCESDEDKIGEEDQEDINIVVQSQDFDIIRITKEKDKTIKIEK